MSTKEASIKCKINDRRIRVLLNEERIEGAIKLGRNWMIPIDATKPIDQRYKTESNFMGIDFSFEKIDNLKSQIDVKVPLNKDSVESLKEKLIVNWTYNSNAIEGNTLKLSETKVVLEGITIGGKSVVEHLEVINHKKAIYFLEDLFKDKEQLSEWNIKNIHSIILKNIDDGNASRYRKANVLISGANHIPPSYEQIDVLMQSLILNYSSNWDDYHPIVRSALLQGEFVKIHPFIDGNGKTARILLNFELMKSGYPPIIIKKENRLEYFKALDKAHTTNDYRLFINIISKLVEESINLWLQII